MSYRKGIFTSSKASVLMKSGRGKSDVFSTGALTYINQKYLERVAGRSFDKDIDTRVTIWGDVMEIICFEKLGSEYRFVNDLGKFKAVGEEIIGGSTDYIVEGLKIAECKSYQFEKWSKYAFALSIDESKEEKIERLKKDFPAEYWQIVWNAYLNDVTKGEAIAFIPTEEDVLELKRRINEEDFADDYGFNIWDLRFIDEGDIDNLPWINEKESGFKSVTKYLIEIPQEDTEMMLERIKLAYEEVNKLKEIKFL